MSELSEEWSALVNTWRRRYGRTGHDLAVEDELRAYQSFVCLWSPMEARPSRVITRRIQDYAVKAAREAKTRTTWTDPDDRYERSLQSFVKTLANDDRFVNEMRRLMAKISPAAVTNSLATLVLKCVVPGVPDFYQGVELFHYTLTDPDNRRPVDFAVRRALLSRLPGLDDPPAGPSTVRALLKDVTPARSSYTSLATSCTCDREHRDLFADGSYQSLSVVGSLQKHALALARSHHEQWVLAIVPRQTVAIARPRRYLTGTEWGDTAVRLPKGAPGHSWTF